MESNEQNGQSVTIKGEPGSIAPVWNELDSKLHRHNYTDDDIFAVHLSLEEAFTNAVKHGNNMDLTKEVCIEYSINSEKVEITVADQGGGFDPDAVPDPRCGENLFKAEGRGLLLIRSYMDKISHNPQGNQLRMIRYRRIGDNNEQVSEKASN